MDLKKWASKIARSSSAEQPGERQKNSANAARRKFVRFWSLCSHTWHHLAQHSYMEEIVDMLEELNAPLQSHHESTRQHIVSRFRKIARHAYTHF